MRIRERVQGFFMAASSDLERHGVGRYEGWPFFPRMSALPIPASNLEELAIIQDEVTDNVVKIGLLLRTNS
jgi:hypothetical protein